VTGKDEMPVKTNALERLLKGLIESRVAVVTSAGLGFHWEMLAVTGTWKWGCCISWLSLKSQGERRHLPIRLVRCHGGTSRLDHDLQRSYSKGHGWVRREEGVLE